MTYLFFFLSFISVILLIIGLIKPSLLSKIFGKIPKRKTVGLLFGGLTLFSLVMIGVTAPNQVEKVNNTTSQENNNRATSVEDIANNLEESTTLNDYSSDLVNSIYAAKAADNSAQDLNEANKLVRGGLLFREAYQ
ncbi:MAG TPA: hypothetical protein DEB69_00855 [Candidatus Komeilibacteria bacterium]|nr:hypothetical protein [Candidatus Komeilibacteria bacterium]